MPHKVSVIVLPGILASPLRNRYTKRDIWRVDKLTAKNLETPIAVGRAFTRSTLEKAELFADAAGCSDTEVVNPTHWRPGDVSKATAIYHPFVEKCGNRLFSNLEPAVYVLNYDWSQSTVDCVDAVIKATMEIASITRNMTLNTETYVMYVAHSMGGLTALAAAAEMMETKKASYRSNGDWTAVGKNESDVRLLGIVSVAAPLWGSAEAFARLWRGFPLKEKSSANKTAVHDRDPADTVAKMTHLKPWLSGKLLANKGWKFSMMAPRIAGFADLLPFGPDYKNAVRFSDGQLTSPHQLAQLANAVMRNHFAMENMVSRSMTRSASSSWMAGARAADDNSKLMWKNMHEAMRLHQDVLWQSKTMPWWKEYVRPVYLDGVWTVENVTVPLSSGGDKNKDPLYRTPFAPAELQLEVTRDGDGTVTVESQKAGLKHCLPGGSGILHADAFLSPGVRQAIYTQMDELAKANGLPL